MRWSCTSLLTFVRSARRTAMNVPEPVSPAGPPPWSTFDMISRLDEGQTGDDRRLGVSRTNSIEGVADADAGGLESGIEGVQSRVCLVRAQHWDATTRRASTRRCNARQPSSTDAQTVIGGMLVPLTRVRLGVVVIVLF